MARWEMTRIEFVGNQPSEQEKKQLAEIMRQHFDYDFPSCFDREENWRSPLVQLQDTLDILHRLGFMCRGWQCRDDDYEWPGWKQPAWVYSTVFLDHDLQSRVDHARNQMLQGLL
jgi:hypothetical protein